MGKYGDTAVRASELLLKGHRSAEDAWRVAAEEMFEDSPDSRAKVCPREAFLGLCQAGFLRGIPATVCRHVDGARNRMYAAAAVGLLGSDHAITSVPRVELWRRVLERTGSDPRKKHNQQMDVVLTLRDRGLITTGPLIRKLP